MKPNPLAVLDLPTDWPTVGIRPDGRTIPLKEAWATMSYSGLAMLVVDTPALGKIAPWANHAGLDDFDVMIDVDGLLSREELQSNGVVDATLETWARDKYQITIDLSKDDADTRAIRWDAWRRYVAEMEQ